MSLTKSQQNALQKQSAIVEAGHDLFLRQGYSATSMDAVAAQANVTKQTVYRYYPSKGELFTAVMETIRAEEPQNYQFKGGTAERELNHFGRELLAFHLTPSAMGVYKLILRGGAMRNLIRP